MVVILNNYHTMSKKELEARIARLRKRMIEIRKLQELHNERPKMFEELLPAKIEEINTANERAKIEETIIPTERSRYDEITQPSREQQYQNQKKLITKGNRILTLNGRTITDIVRTGIDLQVKENYSSTDAARAIGLGIDSFIKIRDMIFLLENTTLNPKDKAIVIDALAEVNRTGFTRKSYRTVAAISKRVFGEHGNHLKSDKKRLTKFDERISYVIGICNAATEIEIPYLSDAQSDAVLRQISEAEKALRKLRERIREGQYG